MSRKFITVPSSVSATPGWCKGVMLVPCRDAVMLGRSPTGGVSWKTMAVQVWYLTG